MMNASERDMCLLNFRPNAKARLKLFCFPYGGGSANIFRRWPDLLPPEIDLWAVEYAGHGGRYLERPFTRMEPLIDDLVTRIAARLSSPFAVFGHSIGGLIGFEVLRRVQQDYHLDAAGFFPSASHSPAVSARRASGSRLSDQELRAELEAFNSNLAKLTGRDELLELTLPTLAADFEISNTYRLVSGDKLKCPVVAYGGMTDSGVSRREIESWRCETEGPFVIRMFPGDHFFIHSQETTLCHVLARDLVQPPMAASPS